MGDDRDGDEPRSITERGPGARVLGQLRHFRVVGRLGVGAMAEVFLARTKQGPLREAVIKRVHPRLADDEDLVTMFLDEARLGMRLSHKNLCRFYDADYVDGRPCLAMEHVHGVTLEELIARSASVGGLPRAIAIAIAADVAAALDSVHRATDEAGRPLLVVHRDVTPRNVMIGFDGCVKLLDFGLAKSIASRSVTQPGTAKGTLAYLAPEVFLGRRPDARADLFALGVCLFEALTARPLYRFARANDVRDAVVYGGVPSLFERDAGAPLALDAILRRCLAKAPEDRFANAAELERALRAELRRDMTAPLAETLATLFDRERALGPALEPTDWVPTDWVPTDWAPTDWTSTDWTPIAGALSPPRS